MNPNENQTRTQSIEVLTAKFDAFAKEIRESVASLKQSVEKQSDEIWGSDDDNIGLKTKVHDLTEQVKRDKEARNYWRVAIGIPVIGLCIDWLVKVLHAIKN